MIKKATTDTHPLSRLNSMINSARTLEGLSNKAAEADAGPGASPHSPMDDAAASRSLSAHAAASRSLRAH